MKERGSYTIEAAIVMSTILFIIFAIISAFLLLYQNVVITYVASQAAQQGAVMWTDESIQMDGSRQGVDDQSVYYRLTELNTGSRGVTDKTKKIQNWAETKMTQMIPNSIVGNGEDRVTVKFEDNVFQRFVTVEIRKDVNIPFSQIMQYFNPNLDMSIKIRANVSEPAEYIRTLDLAYLTAMDAWKFISGKMDGIMKLFK